MKNPQSYEKFDFLKKNNKKQVKVIFKDFWHDTNIETLQKYPLYDFLSYRFDLKITENPDFLICGPFGSKHLDFETTRILFTAEPYPINWHHIDYAFSWHRPSTNRNHFFPYFALIYVNELENLTLPRNVELFLREKTDFCAFIQSNPNCPERNRFFQLLSQYKKINSGGIWLNNLEPDVYPYNPKIFTIQEKPGNYLNASIKNKLGQPTMKSLDFCRSHKFVLSFENRSLPGYLTDRITNGFFSGSVPIYWGDPFVTSVFNPKAFINAHDFPSFEALVDYIRLVDQDDKLYRSYLEAYPFQKNKIPQEIKKETVLDRLEEIFFSPASHSSLIPREGLYAYSFPIQNKKETVKGLILCLIRTIYQDYIQFLFRKIEVKLSKLFPKK